MKKIRFIYLCILLCVILFDCNANEGGNDLTDSLKLLGSLMIVDELPPPNLFQGSPAAVSVAHSSGQLILSMLTPLAYMDGGLYGTTTVRISDVESNSSVSESVTVPCETGGPVTVGVNYSRASDNNFLSPEATAENIANRRYFNWGRLQGSFDINNIANNCKFRILNINEYANGRVISFDDVIFQGNANIRNTDHYFEQFRYLATKYPNLGYKTFIKRTSFFKFNSSNLIVNGSSPMNVSLDVFTKVKSNYIKTEVLHTPCCPIYYYKPQGRIDVIVKGNVDGEAVIVSYSVEAEPFYRSLGKITEDYNGFYN